MKRILTFALVSLTGFAAFAQSSDSASPDSPSSLKTSMKQSRPRRSGMMLIPTLSYGTSKMIPPDMGEISSTAPSQGVFQGGVLVEFGRRMARLQTGLIYMQEGYSLKGEASEGTKTEKMDLDAKINYLGVPLLGKLNVRVSPRNRLIIKGGVIPAVLLSTQGTLRTEQLENGVLKDSAEISTTDSRGMRAVNAFGSIAAGWEYSLTRTQDIRIDASYHRMLLKATDATSSVYTDTIIGSVGFGFDI